MRTLITSIAILLHLSAFAATNYIRAGSSGSGLGGDWANALTDLPTSFTTGDTYLLAGGSYGGHTFALTGGASGTTYLLKATTNDHGTATGWVDYMGTNAIFSSNAGNDANSSVWTINVVNFYIDGMYPTNRLANTNHCGIRLISTVNAANASCMCIRNNGNPADNLVLKHIECQAPVNTNGLSLQYPPIFTQTWPGPTNTLFQNCYAH